MRRGVWFLAGFLAALLVVIVLYNVGLSMTAVVEAPASPQRTMTDAVPVSPERSAASTAPATELPPPPPLEIPSPEDESDTAYFAWLEEATLRVGYLSDRYADWSASVTAAFPDAPDAVRDTGRDLQADWSELGAAIDARQPPERYRQLHARLSDGVKLYTDSTTRLYEALVDHDPNLADTALVFGDLAARTLAPILHATQAPEGAATTPAPASAIERSETPAAPIQSTAAETPTPSNGPPTVPAVVLAERLDVRSGPGSGHAAIGAVASGTELVLDGRDQSGLWVHGRVPALGLEGWFSAVDSMLIQGNVMELRVAD